eukprot:1360607-Alexandrium_andersonii.AAC.1
MERVEAPRMWFSLRLFPYTAAAEACRQATCSACLPQRCAFFWCAIAITHDVMTWWSAREDYC